MGTKVIGLVKEICKESPDKEQLFDVQIFLSIIPIRNLPMLHQMAWAWNSEAFGHILAGNIRRRKQSRPPVCARGTVAPKLREFTKIYPYLPPNLWPQVSKDMGINRCSMVFPCFFLVFLPGLDDGGMLVEAGIGRKDLNQPPDWWFQLFFACSTSCN